MTLDRLLGEHAMLAMFATQKGLKGEDDFEAIAGALDANSRDLADAIGSVYGDQAAKTFLDGDLLWRFHIEQFVAYTVALAKKDEAGQKAAVDKLMGYVEAQSAFLADATGADKAAVRDALSDARHGAEGPARRLRGGRLRRRRTGSRARRTPTCSPPATRSRPRSSRQGKVS